MYNHSGSKPDVDEYSNSSFVLNFNDTSSMPDSIANQIMNRAFVVIIPRREDQRNYYLSRRDHDALRATIDSSPAPNKDLQKLFKDFSIK